MEEEREVELQVEEEHEVEKDSPRRVEPNTQGVIRGSDLFGYVGIEAVLDQMRRKTMKSGFEFNIMVVGKLIKRYSVPAAHVQSRTNWPLIWTNFAS